MSEQGPARIAGLDAWRGILVLVGPIIHATTYVPPTGFTFLAFLSNAFRMGVFFFIAGLMSAQSVGRRGSAEWLGHRIVQLAGPALFSLAFIIPALREAGLITARAQAHAHAGGRAAVMPPFELFHVWFLLALFAYLPVTIMLQFICASGGALERLERRAPSRWFQASTIAVLALVSYIMMLPILIVTSMLPPGWGPTARHFHLIVGYVPIYAAGFLVWRSAPIRNALLASDRLPLAIMGAIVAALAVAVTLAHGLADFGSWSFFELRLVTAAVGPPAASLLVLRWALLMKGGPPVLIALGHASFTIYLLHLPVLAFLRIAIPTGMFAPAVDYLLLVFLSTATCYLLHILLIDRFAPLAFMVNGRRIGGTATPCRSPRPRR